MDIRVFLKKDGNAIQLIGIEKMLEWPVELPLIFIEYIRNNKLKTYEDTKVQKEIEKYLDEIMESVAIPRLIGVLEGDNPEEIILALTRIEELSKKNIDMIKPIQPYLQKILNTKNKKITKLVKTIGDNFQKAERRKELSIKRKLMREKEKLFIDGKISGEDYAKVRKEYLTLKE
ncbi:hypothetical protein LCGC14_0608420 [marine sediment metagenome]|uniref:Uncharacterized protein n=1 Tax=marine sediment metagenome TaxID=412755 RepID=A0A0F9R8M1_9ZZZZ